MKRVTDHRELPALTALWQTCFCDSSTWIEAFWSRLFDRIGVFAEFSGRTPVSMLCALPTEVVDADGDAAPCAYLYAVCTAPEHRKKGHAARLLRFATEELRKDGVSFAALAPAEPSLYDYYARAGFQTVCFRGETHVNAEPIPLKVQSVKPEAYRSLREMQLYGAFVAYDEAVLSLEGRRLLRVETDDAIFCADAESDGQRLLLRELLPAEPHIAAALAAHFGCTTAVLHTPVGNLPCGMLRSLDGRPLPNAVYLPFDFG